VKIVLPNEGGPSSHSPLCRDRPEDIPMLARHFLTEFARRFGVGPFQADTLAVAAASPRIRGRATFASSRTRSRASSAVAGQRARLVAIRPSRASVGVSESITTAETRDAREPNAGGAARRFEDAIDAYERGLIVAALEMAHGNRSLAARNLGINRATLHGKLRKYGLGNGDAEVDD